jgi:hypothetical protein
MKRSYLFLIAVILSFSFVSAHFESYNLDSGDAIHYKERVSVSEYFPEEEVVIVKQIEAHYDNKERYSTQEYRHGYTYRESKNYWKDVRKISKKDYYKKNFKKRSSPRGFYYVTTSYLGIIERRSCYHSAPDDRLFYIKCPN